MTCSYAAQTRSVIYSTQVDPNSGRSHVETCCLTM